MLFKVVNGSVTLGGKTILEEVNFEVKNQEHVGVVGRNGCGKSTLLKAIIGDVDFEKGLGDVDFSISSLGITKIGYVRQDLIEDVNVSLLNYVLKAYDDILLVENKLNRMERDMASWCDEKLLNKYQDLYLHYKNIGGYDYKKEYLNAIRMFGFSDDDLSKMVGEFSFGQRMKIAFLRLVLSKPDLLLLDEPTNHLDIRAIEWLETYLKNYPKMFIVVSHDRMFMDNICNVIYEIEYGSLVRYSGNYSNYEKEKINNYEKNLFNYERQQKEIERLKKIADKFRYKPSKASMALSKLKQIERMIKIEKPNKADNKSFMLKLQPNVESYRDVLKVKNLQIGYDEVLGELNFCLEKGERLGIIGENGTGKSTFLKTIMNQIPKLGGKFCFGNQVEIGYFDQNVEVFDGDKTVLDIMRDEFPMDDVLDLRKMLGTFEFSGDMVFQTVSSLSGGEKVKLLLCKIMRHRPNVLILDEPTNHLDIISKETIEKILLQYKGTIIFVSHDRYLVKKLATKLLVFEENTVNYYDGDYNYYLDKSRIKKDVVSIDIKNNNEDVKLKKKYISDFKEKSKLERRMHKLEDDIQKLENKIGDFHLEMMKEEVYIDRMKMYEFEAKIKDVETELESKLNEWEEIMVMLDN